MAKIEKKQAVKNNQVLSLAEKIKRKALEKQQQAHANEPSPSDEDSAQSNSKDSNSNEQPEESEEIFESFTELDLVPELIEASL